MSYLIEQQQEVTALSQQQTALPQQIQSMHVSFDMTGYPIAPISQSQPVVVSPTSQKNSLLVVGAIAVGLVGAGAIGHYLGASGEAQKSQKQQIQLTQIRSDVANLCKQYNK